MVFRGFGAADAAQTARRLRAATAARGGLLLIGADAALAEAVGADGVHLPERLAGEARRIKAARPDWRVTAAIHGPGPGLELDGIDALIASPVFPTASVSARPLLGLEGLAAVTARGLPTYALGGITGQTAGLLAHSGVCGLAAVAAVQEAFNPSLDGTVTR